MARRGFDYGASTDETDIANAPTVYARRLLLPLHRGPLLELARDAALALSLAARAHIRRHQRMKAALVELARGDAPARAGARRRRLRHLHRARARPRDARDAQHRGCLRQPRRRQRDERYLDHEQNHGVHGARQAHFLESRRIAEQRAFLQDLRLYQLLRKVRAGRRELSHNAPIAVSLADGAPARGLSEPGLDENVLREPGAPAWTEAWAITEKLLLALHAETRSRGARFVVAVLSNAGAVHPDRELRERYARALGVDDLFYPETRLSRFGERHGIEVVTLAPRMQRQAQATGAYLHGFPNSRLGFGHWNAAGHALAAQLIARQLCADEGLVRTDLQRPAAPSTQSAILPPR